jgi:hypothetical protein
VTWRRTLRRTLYVPTVALWLLWGFAILRHWPSRPFFAFAFWTASVVTFSIRKWLRRGDTPRPAKIVPIAGDVDHRR